MVTLIHGWKCYVCDAHGDGPGSNAAAEKHTNTMSHATSSWSAPKEKP